MSDFILPEDITRMARATAENIAEAWIILEDMCRLMHYPLADAVNMVNAYKQSGLTEFEAMRIVYHEVRKP
jgi:hypothetical protein